ncbi:MAG: glycosyltransferase family 2 protein [Acidimicrobiales bacterium]|nr:glycosyltransferase family 2 protein [Acidimicrobiales bacterium]RZV48538.1 MAG: glycosyltransferase family 2 protein [Acidimicrobiales bacterium]
MTTPRLTIGMPVYNGGDYIAEALISHLEQDFTDFELIVSDNCSDDATPDIVQEFVRSDDRVRYSRTTENVGGPANFNRCFRLGEADLFRWAAADDRIEPGYLSKVIHMMDADAGIAIGHCDSVLIDPASDPMLEMDKGWLGGDGYLEAIRLHPPSGDTRFQSDQPHHRVDAVINNNHRNFYIFGVMRRALMLQTRLHGLFYGGDRTLLVELAIRGRFHKVPEPLFASRSHAKNSGRNSLNFEELKQHGAEDLRYAGQVLKGYVQAIRGGELSQADELRCLGMVAKKAKQPTRLLRGW